MNKKFILILTLILLKVDIAYNQNRNFEIFKLYEIIAKADSLKKIILSSPNDNFEKNYSKSFNFCNFIFPTVSGNSNYEIFRNIKGEIVFLRQIDRQIALNNRDFIFCYYKDYIIFYCFQFSDWNKTNGFWINGFFLRKMEKNDLYFIGMNEPYFENKNIEFYEVEIILRLDESLFPKEKLKLANGYFQYKTKYNYVKKNLDNETLFITNIKPDFSKNLMNINVEELNYLFEFDTYFIYVGKVKPEISNSEYPVWINPIYAYY